MIDVGEEHIQEERALFWDTDARIIQGHKKTSGKRVDRYNERLAVCISAGSTRAEGN